MRNRFRIVVVVMLFVFFVLTAGCRHAELRQCETSDRYEEDDELEGLMEGNDPDGF